MYLLLNDEEYEKMGEHYRSLIDFLNSIPVDDLEIQVIVTDTKLETALHNPEELKEMLLDVLEACREQGSISKYKAARILQLLTLTLAEQYIETLLNEPEPTNPA